MAQRQSRPISYCRQGKSGMSCSHRTGSWQTGCSPSRSGVSPRPQLLCFLFGSRQASCPPTNPYTHSCFSPALSRHPETSSGGEYCTCKPLSARIRSPSHITFKATSVLSSDSINNNSDRYCYRFCPTCSVSGSVSELELLGIFTSISQRRARYRKPDFQNI